MTDPRPGIDKPILITGGAGFLGRHLAAILRGRGLLVKTIDVQPDGGPDGDAARCDVRDEAAVRAVVATASAVLHLAAVVGVQRYVADPLAVLDVNILGTRNVLRAAHEAGIPALFASTSEVHGAAVTPLHEDEASVLPNPGRPRWSYAVSKLAGEHYARALHRDGLNVAIVRMFNVYGPGLDTPGEGRVVSRFIGQIQRRAPMTLVDGGGEVRAFCYVDDAVQAMAAVFDHLCKHAPHAEVPTFAIGRDEPVTMADLAARMAWFTDHKAGVVTVSPEAVFGEGIETIPHRIPQLDRLEATTGFRAKTSLNDGLRHTLRAAGLLVQEAPPPPSLLPFVRPHVAADTHLLLRLGRSLVTGALTNQGPHARDLEAALSDRLAAPTLVVSSGTAALVGALTALGVRGAAILPSFTFAATRNAALSSGLRVCYCDVDPITWTLDPGALADLLTRHDDVGVIVAVTAYGVTPDLAAIVRTAGAIPVVLDDAHGFGASRDGLELHPGVAATAMSFHATKVLPAAEGGAVSFRDPVVAASLARLRNHGLNQASPLTSTAGQNLKLSELHAAVALHGLARFDSDQTHRQAHLHRLRAATPPAFELQGVPDAVVTNAQNFALLVRGDGDATTRAAMAVLSEAGVGTRRYFWPPLHRMAVASQDQRGPLGQTERISDRVLCLPLYNRMSEAELRQVEAGLRLWHDR